MIMSDRKRPVRTRRRLSRVAVAMTLSTAIGAATVPANGASRASTGATTGLAARAAAKAICPSDATIVTQPVTTLPSSRHCTILEIGDSLGTDLGKGLHLQLEKSPSFTLVVKTTVAAGLTNSWFYNWPGHLKKFLHSTIHSC